MRIKSNHSQQGVVAVIMVSLLGIGALGMTASGLMSLKSAQPQQLMINTATQANRRAIEGAQIVQSYLNGLDASALTSLSTGNLNIVGATGITATVVSNTLMPNGRYRITVNITGRSVQTASVFQVVYEITPGGSGGGGGTQQVVVTGTVNINSSLNLTGNITVLGNANANLMVTGNVDMQGSVSGVNILCATGNMNISSAISVNRVCSRGSVTLGGAANIANDISAMGDIFLSGGAASAASVNTNSNVTISGGSATTSVVNAKGNVTVSGGSARVTSVLNSEGNVNWTSSRAANTINANGTVAYTAPNSSTIINSGSNVTLSGNGTVQTLNALGNVTLSGTNAGTGVFGNLRAQGNLTFGNKPTISNGQVKGTLSRTPAANQNVARNTSLIVAYTPVSLATLNPSIESAALVDVYLLKDAANYVFEVDASGKRKVTVRNVSGITDGSYFLGNYAYKWDVVSLARGNNDYLCTEVNSSGTCTLPIEPYRTICQGYSASNGCFAYNSSTQTWTISGQSMAPGTAWFSGSLVVSNGTYINTFLSTGAISTSGSLKVFSPNYAGYTPVCTDSRGTSPYSISLDYRLSGLYPTDLCVSGTYVPSALGNTALMAGGYSSLGTYSGGDISVGSSNAIYGNVVAGGLLGTSGNTTIVGAVQVANLANSSGTGTTNWGGRTTIDLSNLPTTFTPGVIPCMTTGGCGGGGGSGTSTARVRWSRFL
ncbi:hypothetical protein [Rhodoferax sp.]|uniref:hypothetical protein n=1 Tax=Rhodoferax sp. TaxID=50421 RepID=UPI00262138D4|nr:hypothetical protein [Rhodoferax sp.]MDD2808175.1 hypothetical protein [Rhodoferax sp.]MDD4944448.1 hypothetical protein [Rhodoferax sp.]